MPIFLIHNNCNFQNDCSLIFQSQGLQTLALFCISEITKQVLDISKLIKITSVIRNAYLVFLNIYDSKSICQID